MPFARFRVRMRATADSGWRYFRGPKWSTGQIVEAVAEAYFLRRSGLYEAHAIWADSGRPVTKREFLLHVRPTGENADANDGV